ncbi:unnamed protein product [Protopolystoma xenopodis]|uniref:Secreted protein n=1 Tax=Protopolystoma xenopodis TaxID=117903 RepID=A0A3S5FGU4_9PLAT|nr:unnamed protein product [Protopolystoma xenopodis]
MPNCVYFLKPRLFLQALIFNISGLVSETHVPVSEAMERQAWIRKPKREDPKDGHVGRSGEATPIGVAKGMCNSQQMGRYRQQQGPTGRGKREICHFERQQRQIKYQSNCPPDCPTNRLCDCSAAKCLTYRLTARLFKCSTVARLTNCPSVGLTASLSHFLLSLHLSGLVTRTFLNLSFYSSIEISRILSKHQKVSLACFKYSGAPVPMAVWQNGGVISCLLAGTIQFPFPLEMMMAAGRGYACFARQFETFNYPFFPNFTKCKLTNAIINYY